MYYLYLSIFLLFNGVISFDMPRSWINPGDLHHSRKIPNVQSVPELDHSSSVKKLENKPKDFIVENESCNCSACDSYLKRVINILLLNANVKNYRLSEDDFVNVPLLLHFNKKNLEILNAHASNKDFLWSDFDEAFISLFESAPKPEDRKKMDNIPYSFLSNVQFNGKFIFITIVGLMVIIGLWLFLTSGSLYKTLVACCLFQFSVALIWNLLRAYNNEKMKMDKFLSRNDPAPSSNGFWSSLGFFTSSFGKSEDDLVFESDPLFRVNYGHIFFETLFSFLHVLPIIGESSGKMFSNFYVSQNWFIKYFVQPIQLILNPVIFGLFSLIIITACRGFSISSPLVSFSVGKEKSVNRNESINPSEPNRIMNNPSQPNTKENNQSKLQRNENNQSQKVLRHRDSEPGPSRKFPLFRRAISDVAKTSFPIKRKYHLSSSTSNTNKGSVEVESHFMEFVRIYKK